MEKQVLILYNVKAGRGRIRRRIDRIEELFFNGGYVPCSKMLRFGQNPFDDCDINISMVVICGGDGTINYVVNAMLAKGLDLPLAVIPSGTANDFAGAIGMSSRTDKAVRQILSGSLHNVDLGRVNDLYFVNVFSFGMFTTTSQHTPEKVKRQLGKAAYLIEGSKELHNREYVPLHIVHDNGTLDVNSTITLIFNGETAGRFPLARKASICDGLLDLVILRKCSLVRGVISAIKYLINGVTNDEIVHIRTSHLSITAPISPLTDMDGQPSAEFPLEVECLKGGLKVIY